jgi:hypothetical protein
MGKRVINFRLSERSRSWLYEKSQLENRSQSQIVDELIRLDEQKKNGYVDELAKAISRDLATKWDGMFAAVNQNNKMLKVQRLLNNYQMTALDLRTSYEEMEKANYTHFAITHAEKTVADEIKALQVAKAEARRKKKGGKNFEPDGRSERDLSKPTSEEQAEVEAVT